MHSLILSGINLLLLLFISLCCCPLRSYKMIGFVPQGGGVVSPIFANLAIILDISVFGHFNTPDVNLGESMDSYIEEYT